MRNTAKTLHPAYRGGYKPILALCIFLLLISCLFLFSNLAIAATYYLDAVRGNDSNPGTSAKPWKTINKAKSTIMEGDYVIVRNGSYGSYNEADVNRTDWVTYQAATGHTPILSGISIDNYPVACNSYLKFDGLKIVSGANKGIWARNARYLQLKNLDLSGSVDTMSYVPSNHQYPGIKLENGGASADALIENCIIHSNMPRNMRMGYTSGIDIYNSDDVSIIGCDISGSGYGIFVHGDNINIINNCVHDIISDGIMIYECNDLLIENNKVHGLPAYKPKFVEVPNKTTWSADGKTMTNPSAKWNTAGETLITPYTAIYVVSGNNVTTGFQDYSVANVVSNTELVLSKSIMQDPNGQPPSDVTYYFLPSYHRDLMQISNPGVSMSNLTFRKNQFYDVERLGSGNFWWLNPSVGGSVNNCLVENNLLWNKYTDEYDERRCFVALHYFNDLTFQNNTIIGRLEFQNSSNVIIRNNIVSFAFLYSSSTYADCNYNLFNRALQGIDAGSSFYGYAHDTVLNPGLSITKWNDPAFTGIFADYAKGDFRHASAASLGVGHGDPANSPSTDILGNPRDTQPDAGCYEFAYVSISKCMVTAGSKVNSDRISLSGTMFPQADDFNDANVIEVTIDSNDMPDPCVLTFPIDPNTYKLGNYSCSKTENGIRKSFKYYSKNNKFSFSASNLDLSGLSCPADLQIKIDDFNYIDGMSEALVNGLKRPIPIKLMMDVNDVLRVENPYDRFQVKYGRDPNSDRLSVRGGFAVIDTDVNMVNEEFVATLGTQTFTLPVGSFKAGRDKFTCSKALIDEGGIAAANFNFNMGSFILTIRNIEIAASPGDVNFGIAFAGYDEVEQVTLPP